MLIQINFKHNMLCLVVFLLVSDIYQVKRLTAWR